MVQPFGLVYVVLEISGMAVVSESIHLSEKERQNTQRIDLGWCLRALQQDGLLDERDATLILGSRQRDQTHQHPLQRIARLAIRNLRDPSRILDLGALTAWVAKKAGLEVWHIDPLKINAAQVTAVMSYKFAEIHDILAVSLDRDEVVIATAQPFHTEWMADLQATLKGRRIRRVVANPELLRRYALEFYNLARSIERANADRTSAAGPVQIEQLLQLGQIAAPDANDQHVVTIVDWIFQYAFEQRASDIHLEQRREAGRMRFRIDGVLHTVYDFPASVMQAVVARIKTLGRMNIAEKRKPQDGRLKTRRADGSEIELRLATLPTPFGEKMVMRVFDPDVLLRSFKDLGLTGDDLRRWNQMTQQPHGIILVTGPTGSGKTTTLYSTLKSLATDEVNVCTVEDPIEMIEPSFNQMQVQHGIDLTFAEGIRAMMRQDPDIIMVGEIRDHETAQMAIQAALTGHLVLSTLHTNDATSAVTRLRDIGVPSYLIAATVLGVMAQRLVRTLCTYCRSSVLTPPDLWKSLTTPWKSQVPDRVMEARGCLECRNTGYLGRVGIYETLLMSHDIRRLVTQDAPLQELSDLARREGMLPLRLSGAQKIAQGLTTLDEVLRVAPLA